VKRSVLLSFVLAWAAWGQADPNEIVRKSIENCERDWRASMSWAWTQTDVSRSDGKDDKKEVTVTEMVPLGGTPFERLIMKDGHPLTQEEQRKEDRRFERALNQRENEPAAEREARIRKYESERAFIRDIPEAYSFNLLGDENVEGRAAWLIQMTPRQGFVPTAPHGAMLEHFEGKLWIDKEDLQWIKAEAHAIDTVSIGWIVARIGPGAHFTFEQARVANGLWMPKRLTITGLVRVMMVYGKTLNEEVVYSGYHVEKQLQAGTR
jgi:hypothetical protein